MSAIYVFKTNLRSERDKRKLTAAFDACGEVVKWNVDLDDRDSVLRVVSGTLCAETIIRLVNRQGYACTELD